MAIQQRTGDAKVKGVADVVFLFDCTGSMAPYIENVKDNVASLIKGFNAILHRFVTTKDTVNLVRDHELFKLLISKFKSATSALEFKTIRAGICPNHVIQCHFPNPVISSHKHLSCVV